MEAETSFIQDSSVSKVCISGDSEFWSPIHRADERDRYGKTVKIW